ncbi:hypothetical protein MVEN_00692300 [Mycena venus]|uniref:Uncharacterized protein n=1 Tax=Mycena venus TaxID=2733690 RepID=A0A8H7D318_9AGAR|nr:hypothetical protein MVEN_00692300 [Mycena venus]
MSSSTRKDHFHVMVMHKIPPHLSKNEFETKLEALIDNALQLPLVQKNLFKVEMIFQTDLSDDHVKVFAFPPKEEVVLVEVQCETAENLLELMQDAEVQKLVENGREFGLHSNSYGFSADVIAKLDNPSPEDAVHMIFVYNVPPHISTAQHDQKFEDYRNNYAAIPAVRKNFVRLEHWKHNTMLDEHFRTFGYSAAGPTFIHHAQLANWDNAMKVVNDPETKQFVLNAGNAGKDFDLKKHSYVFTGRVVTKLDKSV